MAVSRDFKPWGWLLCSTKFAQNRPKISPFQSPGERSFSDAKNQNGAEILPVLIVGAGPVGLFLSILLTKLGINCVVLEKNKIFSRHPQAHFINNRSMELFRKLDGLAEEIQRLQPPVDLWRKFIYCTSLSGPILGSVDHMKPQDFEQIVSPVSVAHFSQYKLTRLLLKKLEQLGFCVCNGDGSADQNLGTIGENKILMGHECVSISPNVDGVMVRSSVCKEGKKTERIFCCNILVGSDGAGSTIRKLAGIDMKGEQDMQNLVSIHFLSRNLGQFLLQQRPGMLFFVFNPEAIGALVAHDLDQGEFVLQIPFYPPQQNLKDFSSKICEEIIFKLVGYKLVDIDIVDIKPWVMHAEVAEKFVSCDNRIILAGDAAHRFPPAGGFGMNTGIQDAHNLAWKIACVVNGIASPSILHTYEMERKPIAIFNTQLSVENFKAAMSVPSALGLDPTIANFVHQAINSGIGSILPTRLQSTILGAIFAIGRAQLSWPLLNEINPLGSSRLARLRSILDEGKSLQLQFPAEDLGFRYLEGALVPDLNGKARDVATTSTSRRRDYIPSAETGSRLPHKYVRVLGTTQTKEILSTLDLINGDKLEFLLIIAPMKESYELACAALKVAKEFKVFLKVCVMWDHGSLHEDMDGSKAMLMQGGNVIEVEEIKWSLSPPSPLSSSPLPSSSSSSSPLLSLSWWELCQMTGKGAILVRPDEHIAWRAKSSVLGDPILEMERVFSRIFGVEREIRISMN